MFKLFSGNSLIVFTILLQSASQISALPNETALDSSEPSIWTDVQKSFKFLLDKCSTVNKSRSPIINPHDNAALMLEDCLKRRGLRALDRALSRDVITINDNIALIKRKTDIGLGEENDSRIQFSKSLIPSSDWKRQFTTKIGHFLSTRVIQINLRNFNLTSSLQDEARHKHKHGGLGSMLMFGLVAAGLIVIPMGFQFLAVLGGKALLLAKLALLLTSIQGLKKIATSNVNYGLYSTGHGNPWPYDRKFAYDLEPYQPMYHTSALDSTVLDKYVKSSEFPSFYGPVNPRDAYIGT